MLICALWHVESSTEIFVTQNQTAIQYSCVTRNPADEKRVTSRMRRTVEEILNVVWCSENLFQSLSCDKFSLLLLFF